jgi:F-type H+-transporting ATPase subunit gamma
MANLKAIRVRITSVRSTRQITSAMKMVAAAKLRKAQDKIIKLRPYVNKLQEILGGLSQSLAETEVENVYNRIPEKEKVLIVVITSNRGLCGAFNTNVIKEARRLISEHGKDRRCCDIKLLTIGKKGYDYFRKQPVNIIGEQNDLFDNVSFDNIAQTAETLMNSFVSGEYDKIELVYNQFKNAAVQILTTEQFLPITAAESDEKDKNLPASVDYIYEPTAEEIVKDLIPR